MKRTAVIQDIINATKARIYLEIGVARGSNFFPIKARHKIGVDPRFGFGSRRKIKWYCMNLCNLHARYYEIESDAFFAQIRLENGLDVVFVDGLHTYEQSFKDVENSLRCLNPHGVIIMHDCNPQSEATARPLHLMGYAPASNPQEWGVEWNGDVWKTICRLRSTRDDLCIFVLDCDQGMGIITRGKPEGLLPFTPAQIDDLTYSDLARNRQRLLNLKDQGYWAGFLRTI